MEVIDVSVSVCVVVAVSEMLVLVSVCVTEVTVVAVTVCVVVVVVTQHGLAHAVEQVSRLPIPVQVMPALARSAQESAPRQTKFQASSEHPSGLSMPDAREISRS